MFIFRTLNPYEWNIQVITEGGGYINNTLCICENELFVKETNFDRVYDEMKISHLVCFGLTNLYLKIKINFDFYYCLTFKHGS